jgi:cysteinyl-tRNA synthetase
MALYVHNTLTRERELFTPGDSGRVTMYVCGSTVYNYSHVGNARPPVVFDVLARLLRRSYQLVYARNVTDVDDKINAAAQAEKIEIGVLTARYLKAFQEDVTALGVLPPDLEPRVTDHLPPIVRFIEKLIAAGHAYEAEGHVLFSVPSYPAYGGLSGRAQEDMLAGARVDVAPYKRDPSDFVLWKPSQKEIVGWPSPWGRGRPGWHIECSTMVEQHLGETIDIHGGGTDLVFPHHENEVAQSVCAHGGKPYVRYWLHNGMVDFGAEKMSKSLGNVVLVRDLLKQHAGEAVRLALLSAHYRQPLGWSEPLIVAARQNLDRMYGALRDAGVRGAQLAAPSVAPPAGVLAALEDDLNTPRALAELHGVLKAANTTADPQERRAHAESLRAGAWLMGLLTQDPLAWFTQSSAGDDLDAAEIDSLIARRDALRKERNFREADRIRDDLAARGVVIEDGAGGARWRRTGATRASGAAASRTPGPDGKPG